MNPLTPLFGQTRCACCGTPKGPAKARGEIDPALILSSFV
jgi:hypothetical protein